MSQLTMWYFLNVYILCLRMCTFARARNVGANLLNVVSRTFPHFSQPMLTPMDMQESSTNNPDDDLDPTNIGLTDEEETDASNETQVTRIL